MQKRQELLHFQVISDAGIQCLSKEVGLCEYCYYLGGQGVAGQAHRHQEKSFLGSISETVR